MNERELEAMPPDELRAVLRDKDASVYTLTFAAEIAGRTQCAEDVVMLLVDLLEHPSAVVREGAIMGLEHHIGVPGVIPTLKRRSEVDASFAVRAVACDVLAEVDR